MLKFAFRSTVNALGAVFSIALLGLFAAAFALWYYAQGLPDYQKLANYEPPIVSRAYAADGRLIGEFASEKRIFMPYASIPKRVAMAFVSAEDQRYFSHPGIDLRAVARALRGNLVYGARLRGGSTITQQVAKNFFFTSERSYYRKIREMLLAFRIERAFDKEKILELYLNQIFLGRQAYGVAAAAQIYFSKALDELTVAEAAFLAALAQAPSRLNPERNARSAVSRRNYVIHRMLEDGHITAAEAEEAKAAPLAIKRPPAQVSVGAEYFVEEVRRDLLAKHGEATMQAGGFVIRSTLDPRLQLIADAALRRGLVAYDRRHGWRGPLTNVKDGKSGDWAMNWRKTLRAVTPPDGLGEWQMALVLEIDATGAEIGLTDGSRGRIPLSELAWARKQGKAAVEPGKPAFKTATGPPIRKAADVLQEGDVILVERIGADARNKPVPDGTYALRQIPDVTGALVAMDPHTGRILAMTGGFNFRMRQFNNTTQAWRQPGSSFKPYVYLTALQEGFTPSTVIADAPISVKDGDKLYQPHNYANKVYGPVPMRTAIELSLNLATLRLAEATGLARIAETATKLGVSDKLLPVMALALGAFETTPLRQVTAYSMIANGGLKITPTLVDRIQDRHGRTIYRHDARDCAACRAATFEGRPMPRLTDTRERIVDEDHAFQVTSFLQSAAKRSPAVANLGRPVAGKTGTTNDMMDAWFVGYTPDLVAAVWVGFDQPRSLGKDETGAMVASPVFADFMRAALKDVPKRDFVRPKGIVAVNLGGPVEYYKRGTEPGTGRGRVLDAYDVADKSDGDPDVSPADRGYAYQRLDLPPPARRAPGFRAPDHHHPRYGYGMGHTY